MRRASVLVVLLGLTLAACVSGKAPIPFELTDEVDAVLIDWQKVGMSCEEPEVGMPGPAVTWNCRGEFDDVSLGARLTADRLGVQSMVAGVPSGTSGAEATPAFVALLRATSLIRSAEPEIENWLTTNESAEGTMPITATTALGRAAVAPDDGRPVLYLVPLGSSILIEQ